MRTHRRKRTLITLILIMLLLIAAAGWWLFQRGSHIGEQRAESVTEVVKEDMQTASDALSGTEGAFREYMIADHVYSHRGSAGSMEHSFQAYDAAIAAGSHNIEQDVVISSDGVLFVSHDISGLTMTGNRDFYKDMTAAEIEELRTYEGNKILRLSEVFDKYGRNVNYLVELKTTGEDTIQAFEDIIEKYDFADIVTVQSDDPDVLAAVEEKFPDMRKMLVCKTPGLFNRALDLPYVDDISVKLIAGLMKEERCRAAHEHGKTFSAWTLDTEDEIRRAIDMGVDSYFTNDTPLALSIEKEYGVKVREENK